MENTIEDYKDQFFALYHGQKVGYYDKFSGWKVDGVVKISMIEYLELTDLKDITDEDAIQICKIRWSKISGESHPYRLGDVQEGRNIIESIQYKAVNTYTMLQIFDYLRSKGYLLPFNGLSTEEIIARGWARIK